MFVFKGGLRRPRSIRYEGVDSFDVQRSGTGGIPHWKENGVKTPASKHESGASRWERLYSLAIAERRRTNEDHARIDPVRKQLDEFECLVPGCAAELGCGAADSPRRIRRCRRLQALLRRVRHWPRGRRSHPRRGCSLCCLGRRVAHILQAVSHHSLRSQGIRALFFSNDLVFRNRGPGRTAAQRTLRPGRAHA